MLVPNQMVEVKIGKSNWKHYKEIGYDIPIKMSSWRGKGIVADIGKTIIVKSEDLPINSHIRVDVMCDICKSISNITYQSYFKGHTYSYDCCQKCSQIKNKKTSIIKYGVDHFLKSPEVIEKREQTNIEKYGGKSPTCDKEVIIKTKQTNLKRYGFECALSSPNIREKRNKTLVKNGTCMTSSQQIDLHKMMQERYPKAILNYPYGRCIFDIALILEEKDIKIDIEYDGWYWHQDQQKDRRRNYYNIRRGWKVLRVKSGEKLPTKEELFEAIDYLINTEHYYKEIKLDDWKDVAI